MDNPVDGGSRSTAPSGLYTDRLVAKYNAVQYITAFIGDNPTSLISPAFSPQSSQDTALTAFAQLIAVRLDVSRALISLLSGEHQYILTEANRTLAVKPISRHGSEDGLWLGCVKIPRGNGVCGCALTPSEEEKASGFMQDKETGVTIIEDLQKHPRYQVLPQIAGTSRMKSYAGVPIVHSSGAKIGVLCVFDEKIGLTLSASQKIFLLNMAHTVMNHLDAVRIRVEHQRRHKLLMGLESFTNGLSDIRLLSDGLATTKGQPAPEPIVTAFGDSMTETSAQEGLSSQAPSRGSSSIGKTAPDKPLWELALPLGAKAMFSRAANIIRQSGEYDGVAFFYIPSALVPKQDLNGGHDSQRASSFAQQNMVEVKDFVTGCSTSTHPVGPSRASSSASSRSCTSVEEEKDRVPRFRSADLCPVLGYSLGSEGISDIEDQRQPFPSFTPKDLARLLGKTPKGRIFVLNQEGQIVQGENSTSGSDLAEAQPDQVREKRGREIAQANPVTVRKFRRPAVRSLQKLSAKALSFTSLPLWDFERQRWFAYAVCWSNSVYRDPNTDGDLDFLRIFSSSIMNALAHIDVLAVDRAKNAFVSSISHELRSPLHGVMTATNLLQDSDLNPFQNEMVNSISKCGRTLLDTLDHVMEFAKVKAVTNRVPQESSVKGEGARHRYQSNGTGAVALSENVDLVALLEEVLDSVLMGFTVQHNHILIDDNGDVPQALSPKTDARPKVPDDRVPGIYSRGRVRLVLRVEKLKDRQVVTQAGAWRRIIMNLFGNALKYTADGIISVEIETRQGTRENDVIVLFSVSDTGTGISKEYLENRLFQPFSQEDPFQNGTGLGLSIVDQIVESMKGKTRIASTKGVGTVATVTVPTKVVNLESFSDSRSSLNEAIEGHEDIEICLFDDANEDDRRGDCVSGESAFVSSLFGILTDWCRFAHVHMSSQLSLSADITLLLRPSFKAIDRIQNFPGQAKTRCVIIVAYDALEMAALQTDARLQNGSLIIEIVCQPLGPRKLAASLRQCIARGKVEPPVGQAITLAKEPLISVTPLTVTEIEPLTHDLNLQTRKGIGSVLIVDDNKINLRLLGAFLKKLKVTYDQAMDGQEAVDLYVSANGSYECVLMDISMPIMDGITATQRIREYEKEAHLDRVMVAALTGLTSAAAQSDAFEVGVDLYLTKPISLKMLQASLPKHLLECQNTAPDNKPLPQ